MKHLLYVILENNENAGLLLLELSKQGFNGTVIDSTSLKHALQSKNADDIMFLGLRHLTTNDFERNTTLYMILEDEQVVCVQNIIREITEGFTKPKGGMFVVPLENYEGSFSIQ